MERGDLSSNWYVETKQWNGLLCAALQLQLLFWCATSWARGRESNLILIWSNLGLIKRLIRPIIGRSYRDIFCVGSDFEIFLVWNRSILPGGFVFTVHISCVFRVFRLSCIFVYLSDTKNTELKIKNTPFFSVESTRSSFPFWKIWRVKGKKRQEPKGEQLLLPPHLFDFMANAKYKI